MPFLPLFLTSGGAALYVLSAAAQTGTGNLELTPEQVRWIVYGALGFLVLGGLQGFALVLQVVRHFRADPPYATKPQHDEGLQVVKSDLTRIEKDVIEIKRDHDNHWDAIYRRLGGIDNELRSLNRSVGRVEGPGKGG